MTRRLDMKSLKRTWKIGVPRRLALRSGIMEIYGLGKLESNNAVLYPTCGRYEGMRKITVCIQGAIKVCRYLNLQIICIESFQSTLVCVLNVIERLALSLRYR